MPLINFDISPGAQPATEPASRPASTSAPGPDSFDDHLLKAGTRSGPDGVRKPPAPLERDGARPGPDGVRNPPRTPAPPSGDRPQKAEASTPQESSAACVRGAADEDESEKDACDETGTLGLGEAAESATLEAAAATAQPPKSINEKAPAEQSTVAEESTGESIVGADLVGTGAGGTGPTGKPRLEKRTPQVTENVVPSAEATKASLTETLPPVELDAKEKAAAEKAAAIVAQLAGEEITTETIDQTAAKSVAEPAAGAKAIKQSGVDAVAVKTDAQSDAQATAVADSEHQTVAQGSEARKSELRKNDPRTGESRRGKGSKTAAASAESPAARSGKTGAAETSSQSASGAARAEVDTVKGKPADGEITLASAETPAGRFSRSEAVGDRPSDAARQSGTLRGEVQADTSLRPAADGSRTATARTSMPIAHGQVDRGRFVQRVARAVETAVELGGPLKLRLSPPELGALRLEISLRDGVMSARLEAETPAAHAVLMESLPGLRERLAQHDIRVERFDIDMAGQSLGGAQERSTPHDNQQRENGTGHGRARLAARPMPPDAAPPVQARIVGSEQLNVVI